MLSKDEKKDLLAASVRIAEAYAGSENSQVRDVNDLLKKTYKTLKELREDTKAEDS